MSTPVPQLTIVVPVYQEQERVERALQQVLEVELPVEGMEVVVVDDGSTDGTADILASLDLPGHVRLLRHDRNLGKGAAIRTALQHAHGEFAAVMDADLEYAPEDLADVLRPLLNGEAEAVFGVRGFQSHSSFNFWYVVGNKFVTLVANVIFNAWISDLMTGQKAMRTSLFRSLPLRERGFAIEAEITARLLRSGVRIYEVPVTYMARGREEGKKLTSVDGLRVLFTLVRCRLTHR